MRLLASRVKLFKKKTRLREQIQEVLPPKAETLISPLTQINSCRTLPMKKPKLQMKTINYKKHKTNSKSPKTAYHKIKNRLIVSTLKKRKLLYRSPIPRKIWMMCLRRICRWTRRTWTRMTRRERMICMMTVGMGLIRSRTTATMIKTLKTLEMIHQLLTISLENAMHLGKSQP